MLACSPVPADSTQSVRSESGGFVVIQDQMLSTAQQMLQESRSKIELIRLQIIRVTQAGGGGGGGSPDTHGGQRSGPPP